ALKLLKVADQVKRECKVIKERDKAREVKCVELEAKMLLESQKWARYEKNLATFVSNIAMLEDEKSRLEEVETWLLQEVADAKHDRVEVVSKVVP
ncbi:hypothetical protein Tco_1512659, partial [Tanacetum coccineum]